MLVRANWARARSTFTTAHTLTRGRGSSRSITRLCSRPNRGRRPRGDHRHAPARHASEVEEVHAEIGRERDRARQLEAADRADRAPAADDGQRPLVEVAERLDGAGATGGDPARDMARLLDRHRRQPGQRLAVGPGMRRGIADHRDLRMPGQRAVGQDLEAAAAVVLGPGGLRERAGERRRVHAGRPDHRRRVDPPRLAALVVGDARGIDRGGARALAHVDAQRRQLASGLGRQLRAERGEHALAGVEQDDADVARIEARELVAQVVPREHGELPGDLDARRAASDHDDRQEAPAAPRRPSPVRPPRRTTAPDL